MVTPGLKVKRNYTIEKAEGISNPVSKRLYTLKEAAEYLGRSEWSMRELIWAGEVPVVRKDGGRKIFVDVLDLMDFIAKHKTIYI